TIIDRVSVLHAHLPHRATLALGRTELAFEVGEDHVKIPLASSDRFGTLIGRSSAMRELFAKLARIAQTDSSVLIEGETGTGKELVAEQIHAHSQRAKRPFIVVDCGAIAGELFESELFDHV